MEDLAGAFPFEAGPRHVVEPVLRPADVRGGVRGRARGRDLPAREARADLVLRAFDAAVVHGVGDGAVERQHAPLRQCRGHLGAVEVGPVVALEEQRRAVEAERLAQHRRDLGVRRDAPGVEPEHQTEAEDYFNQLAAFDEHRRWDILTQAITSINNVLMQGDGGRFQKPLLTVEEAASMLSLSPKRFKNIICEERARLGRSPDFLCDANGRICCRVLRDELLEWARGRNRKSGRAASVRRRAV